MDRLALSLCNLQYHHRLRRQYHFSLQLCHHNLKAFDILLIHSFDLLYFPPANTTALPPLIVRSEFNLPSSFVSIFARPLSWLFLLQASVSKRTDAEFNGG